MSKRIPLQFEKIDMAPIDALGLIRIDLKDIDERTDKILEITHSVAIEHEIDKIWDSAEELAYTAAREIERLRGECDYKQAAEYWQRMYEEAFAERTCEYVGDDVSGGCSECRGWLDPGCAYCPSCGAKVVNK